MPRDVELVVRQLFDADLDLDPADKEPAHFGLALRRPLDGRRPIHLGYRGLMSLPRRALFANVGSTCSLWCD